MLKSLTDRMQSLFGAGTGPVDFAVGDTPEPGYVYSFQTSPYSEFAPASTGRYAAFKIIGANADLLAISVYDGVWNAHPTMAEFRKAKILREHRFAHTGREAIFGTQVTWWDVGDFDDLTIVGYQKPTGHEKTEACKIFGYAVGSRTSSTLFVNYAAEGEWRWNNDRAALEAEQQQKNAKNAAERKAQEERYRNRLSNLTWDQLLTETPFERWTPSPPYPPADFTTAARAKIHQVCTELQALGPKPRKADVRRILKACVAWFNAMDEEAGNVIETEEREDICAVLEEVAFVAKQKSLVEEIGNWRDW